MLKISIEKEIAIIEMDNGIINAISPVLVSKLRKKLHEMSNDDKIIEDNFFRFK